MSRGYAARLAEKPCRESICPNEMKNLWAASHLAVMRWEEFMLHPDCPELRAKVSEHMRQLKAAAKIAEPVMEVRLAPASMSVAAQT